MTVLPTDEELLAEIATIFSNAYRESSSEAAPTLLASLNSLCALCGAPVDGFQHCYKCNMACQGTDWVKHKPAVIAPIAYAVGGTQAGLDVHKYKDESGGAHARRRMKILLYLFVKNHLQCLARVTGAALTHVTAVPSGKGRTDHPLVNSFAPFIGKQGLNVIEAERVAPARPSGVRQTGIDSELFKVDSLTADDHVLVLEDTWATGASCLSLAIALSKAGAGTVSLVPLARFLNTQFGPTKSWLDKNMPLPPYDPSFCPISKSPECP